MFDDGFILGLSLGCSGGDTPEPDKPSYLDDPDYALYQALPEPAENQFEFIIRIIDAANLNVSIQFSYTEEFTMDDMSDSAVTVDWGDGTVSPLWSGNNHKYNANGDYIITVTDNTGGKLFLGERLSYSTAENVAAKIGKNILYSSGGNMYGMINGRLYSGGLYNSSLKYVKLNSDEICRTGFKVSNSLRLVHIDFDGSLKLKSLESGNFSNLNALSFDNFDIFFQKIEEIPGNNCFSNCYNLKKLYLPNCKKIGTYCFQNCYILEKVSLQSCTEIGAYCFQNCYILEKVSLQSCTEIGAYCFQNCYSLIDVDISKECTYGNNVFYNCRLLSPAPNGRYPEIN